MKILNRIFHWIGYIIIFFFVSSILSVVILKWMPVYYTPLMFIRCGEQIVDGDELRMDHEWIPIDKMPNYMMQAVVASEDANFMKHHGFDYKAIIQAMDEKERGGQERGASTISQQTAKNVFLWPGHSWIRKGFEAYFTVLIEFVWGKERIMEVYLNSIEMGRGVYGIKAAANYYYDTTPAGLTRNQCIDIAVILPNPLEYDPRHLTGNQQKKRARVSRDMPIVKSKMPWGISK